MKQDGETLTAIAEAGCLNPLLAAITISASSVDDLRVGLRIRPQQNAWR
ncbi:MAG: hypothetical protein Q8Q88_12635 [Phenylobacterium sp.]|nr:hypothetical protein [Phenylobacterium sp.]MDP3747882.1 hypothetical protein [Phenylobacterium sp.]